jgi:hypothetical protein
MVTTETSAKPEADNGRESNGQFEAGNKGGPGNPFARHSARLRKMLLETVTDDDMRAVFGKLIELARGGDLGAIKLLLAYAIGKPAEAVDPDTVDLKELRQYQESSLPPQEMARVLGGLPPEMVCGLVRLFWPVTAQATVEPLAQGLRGGTKAMGSETCARRAERAEPTANGGNGAGPTRKPRKPVNGAANPSTSRVPPPVDPPRPEDEDLLRHWLGVEPKGNGSNGDGRFAEWTGGESSGGD